MITDHDNHDNHDKCHNDAAKGKMPHPKVVKFVEKLLKGIHCQNCGPWKVMQRIQLMQDCAQIVVADCSNSIA